MSQSDFLNEFEEQMARLAKIRGAIEQSLQFKEQFTNDLKTKLANINQKLKELSTIIKTLKGRADDLEGQIGTNSGAINDKEQQLRELEQRIRDTEQQYESLRTQLTNEIKTRQQTIDDCEEQLRKLTEENELLKNQVSALNEQMRTSGDDQKATAAQKIKEITENSQKQLDEQREQLTQQIDELQRKIEETNEEKQKIQDELTGHQGTSQDQLQLLQKQIDELKTENENLIFRLRAATESIKYATDKLEELMNSVPNAQTKQEVDALLNEIEATISDISSTAQGQPIRGTGEKLGMGESKLPDDTIIPIYDKNTKTNVGMSFSALKDQLKTKSEQVFRNTNIKNNKYERALKEMESIQSPDEIGPILRNKGINIKDNNVMGGRKTKKNRKQKGGFIYKSNTRRKILSNNSRRSSKRSSRRSSRRSSG